jgi:hypothetical protein
MYPRQYLRVGVGMVTNDCKQLPGGEGGIRTPDTLASMPHFECGAFNHSATSPEPETGLKRPLNGRALCNQQRQDRQGSGGVYCARLSEPVRPGRCVTC